MPYIPKPKRGFAPRPVRSQLHRLEVYLPNSGMGSLFGDILSGVKTAVVTTVDTSITKLKEATVTTAQQEAAALASKLAMEALRKKGTTTVAPAPGTPEAPAPVPGQGMQTVYIEAPGLDLKKYLPYVGLAAGAMVLVVLIRRRK